MKTAGVVAKWLFVLCLPVLLLAGSISVAANSLWLYQYGFEKYEVGQATGLADAELEKAARGLIGYFNSGEEYIELTVVKDGQPFTLFNRQEIIHFKDVKELFRLNYRVLLVTLVYVLAYAVMAIFWRGGRYRRRLAQALVWGSGVTLGLMLVVGIGMLLDFDRLFLQFHLLAFTNEFWSAEGYMLQLFPGGFWFDAALFCVLEMVLGAVVLGGVGVWIRRRTRTGISI